MVNRIFKLIVIMSICLNFTIGSYAAVSVSDGSAFVTKVEFNADLNNLSNRMAQLENSLDAKIDSLVSSYLTRNGIWSGEKQSIKTYTIKYKDILPVIRTAIASIGGNLSNDSKYFLFSWTAVEHCSKSGMLVVDVQCNHSWNYDFSCGGSAEYKHSIWQGAFDGYMQIDRLVNLDTYEMIGSINGAITTLSEAYTYNTAYLTVSVPSSIISSKVFVTKDDQVVLRLALVFSGRVAPSNTFTESVQYTASCYIDTTNVTSATDEANNTDLTWMVDANIY